MEASFEAQTRAIRERVEELTRHVAEAPARQALATEALERISALLEELQVAGDEMRKQNEELAAGGAIAEAERRHYYELFESVPEAYLVTDVRGVIRQANIAATVLLGAGHGSAMGKLLALYVAQEERRAFRAQLRLLLQQAPHREWNTHVQPPGCSPRPVVLRAAAARDANGNVAELRWFLRDSTERKRADEALRESEARYRCLFEDSPISVWEEDFSEIKRHMDDLRCSGIRDLRAYWESHPEDIARCAALVKILDVNRATLDVFGAKSKQELLSGLPVVFEPESYDAFREELVALAEGKTAFTVDATTRKLDGNTNHIVLRWCVAPGYEQTLARVIVSITDVTEQRRAAEALRESEEKWHALVENSPDHIMTLDRDARIQFINRTLPCLSREAVVGTLFHTYVLPGHRAVAEQCFAQVLTTGEPGSFDSTYRCEDGTVQYFESRVWPIRSGDAIVGLTVSSRDITERKQAEESLRRKDQFVGRILETSPAGIIVLDPQGQITFANGRAEKILGLSKDKTTQRAHNPPDWHMEDHDGAPFPGHQQVYRRVMATGQPVRGAQQAIERSDGRRVHLCINAAPLFDGSGQLEGVIAAIEDISERVQTDEALRRSLEEAAHGQRALLALSQAAQAVQRAHTPEEIYRTICSEVTKLGYHAVILTLSDDGKSLAVSHQTFGPAQVRAAKRAIAVSEHGSALSLIPGGFLEGIIAGGETAFMLASELATETLPEALRPLGGRLAALLGVEEAIVARLTVGGETRGLLVVSGSTLTEADVPAVTTFANQAGIAIANARLFAQTDVRRRYLETLLHINATLRSTLPAVDVLQTIAQRVGDAFGYVGSLILVPDEAAHVLRHGASWGSGLADAVMQLTGKAVDAFDLPPRAEQNPIVSAYLDAKSLTTVSKPQHLVRGVRPHVPAKVARTIARTMGARSAVCVPLRYGDKAVGVLVAFSPRELLSEEERAMLLGIADQAGLAIENARLFQEVSSARQRLQALSRRLVGVQEEERRRFARELHDEIGQVLTGLKITIDMALILPPAEAQGSLVEARALSAQLLTQVRDLSLTLRPAMLDDLGLLPALLWHMDRYTAQTGVRVKFHHYGLEDRRFPVDVETAAYRIAQEALTNVARHAGVEQVAVGAWADATALNLEVRDRGRGFDPAVVSAAATAGMAGMHERAVLLGGRLVVGSAPGKGTSVRATFPVAALAHDGREGKP